jgi:hypothetical protein
MWGRDESHVGLLALNELRYPRGDAVSHSARSGSVSRGRFEDRELMPSAVREQMSVPRRNHQLMNELIERRSELVQDFAREQHQRWVGRTNGGILNSDQPCHPLAVVNLWMQPDRVGFEIGIVLYLPMKVVNVGFCPL